MNRHLLLAKLKNLDIFVVNGYGVGCVDDYGNDFGSGYGPGTSYGSGYGDGFGFGYSYGSGNGFGFGRGYGKILSYNESMILKNSND
jgi:hypothetical protein